MTLLRDKNRDEEEVELTPEELAELDESIAEIERGEYVTAEECLRRVREILYGTDRRRKPEVPSPHGSPAR